MSTTAPSTGPLPRSRVDPAGPHRGRAGGRRSLARRARILRRDWPLWGAFALLIPICFLWIYPFLWVLSASLKDQLEVFTAGLSLIPDQAQWSNYARAWNEADFGTYLVNTVLITVGTVIIVVIRCAMAGYVIARYQFLGKKAVVGVLLATLIIPEGYTIIPVVEVTQRLGLLNSLWGITLALGGAGHVAAILLYAGYFAKIPRELEESALLDGAGFFTVFFRIMLPLAGPVTATVALLTFLAAWNAFFLPLVFTFSRPELRTASVGMLSFIGESSTDWTGMAAAATISVIPVILLFFFLQRYFFDGIAGAVKS